MSSANFLSSFDTGAGRPNCSCLVLLPGPEKYKIEDGTIFRGAILFELTDGPSNGISFLISVARRLLTSNCTPFRPAMGTDDDHTDVPARKIPLRHEPREWPSEHDLGDGLRSLHAFTRRGAHRFIPNPRKARKEAQPETQLPSTRWHGHGTSAQGTGTLRTGAPPSPDD